MNGERQMLPVHTIRTRASSPMAKSCQPTRLGWTVKEAGTDLILSFAYPGRLVTLPAWVMTHDAPRGATPGQPTNHFSQ